MDLLHALKCTLLVNTDEIEFGCLADSRVGPHLIFPFVHGFALFIALKYVFVWTFWSIIVLCECQRIRSFDKFGATGCMHTRLETLLGGGCLCEESLHLWRDHCLLFYHLVCTWLWARSWIVQWLSAWVTSGLTLRSRSRWLTSNHWAGGALHFDHNLQVLGLPVYFSETVQLLDVFVSLLASQGIAIPWGWSATSSGAERLPALVWCAIPISLEKVTLLGILRCDHRWRSWVLRVTRPQLFLLSVLLLLC